MKRRVVTADNIHLQFFVRKTKSLFIKLNIFSDHHRRSLKKNYNTTLNFTSKEISRVMMSYIISISLNFIDTNDLLVNIEANKLYKHARSKLNSFT